MQDVKEYKWELKIKDRGRITCNMGVLIFPTSLFFSEDKKNQLDYMTMLLNFNGYKNYEVIPFYNNIIEKHELSNSTYIPLKNGRIAPKRPSSI